MLSKFSLASFFSIKSVNLFSGNKIIVFVFFFFFKKSNKAINWDSKLTPMLMILLENSGLIFEGEMKIKSLYLLTFSNSLWVVGPIITFTSKDLKSSIAILSFSLLLKPTF